MTARKTILLSALTVALPALASAQAVLFHDGFRRPNGLITNDYATFHPGGEGAKPSDGWLALSGSLFAVNHAAWTGVPDNHIPQAGATKPTSGTRSAQFRVVTQNADFGDIAVSFDLFNQGLVQGPATPRKAYDGVHVLLRYQGNDLFYAVSVNRRDNTVSIKKKIQSGTYVDLTPSLPLKVRYNRWQRVTVTARNEADGSVTLQAFVGGKIAATATDAGVGGPALRGNGRVGLRGDNCEFLFSNFTVAALPAGPAGASAGEHAGEGSDDPKAVPGGDVPAAIPMAAPSPDTPGGAAVQTTEG
jgi:hypothetical protein